MGSIRGESSLAVARRHACRAAVLDLCVASTVTMLAKLYVLPKGSMEKDSGDDSYSTVRSEYQPLVFVFFLGNVIREFRWHIAFHWSQINIYTCIYKILLSLSTLPVYISSFICRPMHMVCYQQVLCKLELFWRPNISLVVKIKPPRKIYFTWRC